MLWSTHIDQGVDILRADPQSAPTAALTHFCSAGYPPLGMPPPSPRLDKAKRFICAFHNHTLSNGTTHWTMSWIDIRNSYAVHFDSLWDDQGTNAIAESLQSARRDRESKARKTMLDWLAGTWADIRAVPPAKFWHYLTGSKTMQQDGWSCGLQMLETLRVILESGGTGDVLDELRAEHHRLSPAAVQAWKTRFEQSKKA